MIHPASVPVFQVCFSACSGVLSLPHTHTETQTHMCAHTYTHTHTHTYTQTHTHTHTHCWLLYTSYCGFVSFSSADFHKDLKGLLSDLIARNTCLFTSWVLSSYGIKVRFPTLFCPRKCVGNIIIEQCSGNLPEILLYNITLI